MKKRIITIVAGVLALTALVCALLILPKERGTARAESQAKSAEAVELKSGYYYGKSIDQGQKSLVIDTVQKRYVLHFTQCFDSFIYSGFYTVEGDRLKAGTCTFKIESDGSLMLLKDESRYFERKPSPFYADFEDGTVFIFGEELPAGISFGF